MEIKKRFNCIEDFIDEFNNYPEWQDRSMSEIIKYKQGKKFYNKLRHFIQMTIKSKPERKELMRKVIPGPNRKQFVVPKETEQIEHSDNNPNCNLLNSMGSNYSERFKKNEIDFDFLSVSSIIKKLKEQVLIVAQNGNKNILISGKTGVGKGHLVNYFYKNSNRSDKPLIEINCATIPKELMESEFFGHVKGSFTSAHQNKTGYFEAANGGTIFLDEIGDMSWDLQAKLLKVIEEQCFCQVGSSNKIKVDVRVIAATNQNLELLVEKGLFREDLYYRLNVISFNVPELKNRASDIPILAHYFLFKNNMEHENYNVRFEPEVIEFLETFNWPGNIRQLKNSIERAHTLCSDGVIKPIDFGIEKKTLIQTQKNFNVIKNTEMSLVLDALKKSDWSQKEAAKLLGVSKRIVHYKIKKFGITHDNWIKNV
jgi:two-component system, NtrC family, response regulator HydG